MRNSTAAKRSAPLVVLFDIDGTLLRRSGPHHRECLIAAVRRATGIETTTDRVPVHGMLDRDILTWMLRDAGASPDVIAGAMDEMVRRAQSLYVRRCPDLRAKVCPGVRPFLARLRRRGVPMGLGTGNLTRIGWRKMRAAGLGENFRFGAFSEMGKTRGELIALALNQARQRGWLENGTRVWHVGDHPNDVNAARENGIRCLAVGTGLSPLEELASHAPDLLVPDLTRVRIAQLVEG
jgi:phosphoglycolate phosphatase-like HAD superfamily hydrolase